MHESHTDFMIGGYKVPADGDTDHMFIAPGPNVRCVRS